MKFAFLAVMAAFALLLSPAQAEKKTCNECCKDKCAECCKGKCGDCCK